MLAGPEAACNLKSCCCLPLTSASEPSASSSPPGETNFCPCRGAGRATTLTRSLRRSPHVLQQQSALGLFFGKNWKNTSNNLPVGMLGGGIFRVLSI
ncbi:hypothetical protein [Microcoleus sp. herbarium12]|uniref:hypothetical protein n=1 Tax=Microcoleus sp. herbarium12 TaxID=3055437 RepID=UPI002FD0D82C